MIQERVRHLRETLYVLQNLLRNSLMYDSLISEEEDRLNFFRIYKGSLMTEVVLDWWKIFGNHTEPSHWKKLFPEDIHDELRNLFEAELVEFDEDLTLRDVWDRIEEYRNRFAAHLDFDEANRPAKYPFLTPLRLTTEVLYSQIYSELDEVKRASGFPSPENVTGFTRDKYLKHWTNIATKARAALIDFDNDPK